MNTTTSHHRLSHHPTSISSSTEFCLFRAESCVYSSWFHKIHFCLCVIVQMQCKASTHFSIFLSACNPFFLLLPIWCEFFPFYFFQDWYDIKLFYFIFPIRYHFLSLFLSLCMCAMYLTDKMIPLTFHTIPDDQSPPPSPLPPATIISSVLKNIFNFFFIVRSLSPLFHWLPRSDERMLIMNNLSSWSSLQKPWSIFWKKQ